MSSRNSADDDGERVERRHVRTGSDDPPLGAASQLLVSRPDVTTLASVTVTGLLFGGLALVCLGATWAVLATWGVPAAVAVAGLGMVVSAFVVAQVLSHVGVI